MRFRIYILTTLVYKTAKSKGDNTPPCGTLDSEVDDYLNMIIIKKKYSTHMIDTFSN